eukprot:395979-Rhodomonas_salina.1
MDRNTFLATACQSPSGLKIWREYRKYGQHHCRQQQKVHVMCQCGLRVRWTDHEYQGICSGEGKHSRCIADLSQTAHGGRCQHSMWCPVAGTRAPRAHKHNPVSRPAPHRPELNFWLGEPRAGSRTLASMTPNIKVLLIPQTPYHHAFRCHESKSGPPLCRKPTPGRFRVLVGFGAHKSRLRHVLRGLLPVLGACGEERETESNTHFV